MEDKQNVWYEKKIHRWLDLRRVIDTINDKKWVFRGQNNYKWSINSIFYRTIFNNLNYEEKDCNKEQKCINIETKILDLFKSQKHMFNYEIPQISKNDLEEFSILQHYGAPTRLLDWSYSPYIALFFAADNAIEDFSLFALNIDYIKSNNKIIINSINSKYKDSNSFQRSNINFLNCESIINFGKFQVDAEIRNEHLEEKILIDFYDPETKNQRIVRQQGLFLVPSKISIEIDSILKNFYKIKNGKDPKGKQIVALKLTISNDLKREILYNLKKYNIDNEILFPGIDGFCKSLRNKVLLNESSYTYKYRYQNEEI